MAKITQEAKNLLGMAGEFLVAAELNRRGIHAAVTYGSAKSADIYAFGPESNRAIRIEVKSTQDGSRKWVIGEKAMRKENWLPGLFWVLVILPKAHPSKPPASDLTRARHSPRFFVFSAEELGEELATLDRLYRASYRERHGTESVNPGVVQLPTDAEIAGKYENQWDKIEERVRGER